ncbi:recombinase family protein [Bradyrhizobium sp. MOS003]|uniref:recombinase family protein n=1 Tax=Bradyrhizobium sp. MOS003 TaxID=2133946 RepID=UPI0032DEC358
MTRQAAFSTRSSETWSKKRTVVTAIDSMLRNRATYGEYQPKSFAAGHKRGIPSGPPISNYYPAAIDKATFDAAQVARQHCRTAGAKEMISPISSVTYARVPIAAAKSSSIAFRMCRFSCASRS